MYLIIFTGFQTKSEENQNTEALLYAKIKNST